MNCFRTCCFYCPWNILMSTIIIVFPFNQRPIHKFQHRLLHIHTHKNDDTFKRSAKNYEYNHKAIVHSLIYSIHSTVFVMMLFCSFSCLCHDNFFDNCFSICAMKHGHMSMWTNTKAYNWKEKSNGRTLKRMLKQNNTSKTRHIFWWLIYQWAHFIFMAKKLRRWFNWRWMSTACKWEFVFVHYYTWC